MAIWGSVNDLQDHPLLFRALNNIQRKIENCLSRSYDICDSDDVTDHRSVLLGLQGRFRVAAPKLPGGEGTSVENAYAESGSDGITFNRQLVMASTTYFNQEDDSAKDDLTTESYLAIFEETIEHKLAHLKMHQERLGGSFAPNVGTPDGPPYYSESGYAVRRRISARAVTVPASASILEVSEDCINRDFTPPLSLCRVPLSDFNDEENDVSFTENPLSLEELRTHMKYPNECPQGKRVREAATEVATGKRSKTGDEGKPSARDTSSSPRRSSGHRAGSAIDGRDTPRGTDETGQDQDERRNTNRIPDFHCRSSQSCQVQVVFCDKERNEKATFRPSERIYVLLTFKNPTPDDAYIKISKLTFQRGPGVFMAIDGCEMMNTACQYGSRIPIVRIPPGDEYTFFRLLCAPHEEWRTTQTRLVTPRNAGDYVAKVKRHPSFEFPGSFSFTIQGEMAGTPPAGQPAS